MVGLHSLLNKAPHIVIYSKSCHMLHLQRVDLIGADRATSRDYIAASRRILDIYILLNCNICLKYPDNYSSTEVWPI